MGTRLAPSALVVLVAASVPSAASARAVCGHTGRALVDELEGATAVFVGRMEGPALAVHPVAPGYRGSPAADVSILVTRVVTGPLHVGDRVTLRWEGWAEEEGGPLVGGCRVPGTEADERYPIEMLVVARGSPTALRVANDSSSTRVGPASRAEVQRIARLARRVARRARPGMGSPATP